MSRALKTKRTVSAPRTVGKNTTAAAVLEAIECLTTIPRESIAVTVHGGWVRIKGTLPDWSQRETVDHIVRGVPGVKGLISLIEVNPPRSQNKNQL
jgi:osmotically-inducible protein OsmY